jgi:hypothetical protein
MISHATIIGRSHRLMQQNCHDFAITGRPTPDCAFGLVLDGCGSKHRDETGLHPSHNEVGAKLLGQFTAVYLTSHLPHHDLDGTFFANLYAACSNYLQRLFTFLPATDAITQTRFIATHLLCTMVGFVMKGETAVFFWSGDGFWAHDDAIIQLDSNNQPDYLAYHLDSPDGRFQTHTLHNPHRLAVASDGWTAAHLSQLDTPQSSLALQRWLNLQAKERGTFEDDGAIAIWWKNTQ